MKVIEGGFRRRDEPDTGVIDMLRDAMEAAERGEIVGVFMVAVMHDESIMSGWKAGDAPVFAMLGGIENTKLDFVATEIEGRP